MCGFRDEADVAVALSLFFQVALDAKQPGILTLRAGVGLKRNGIETGDLTQHGLEFLDQVVVTLGLIQGCKRVNGAELVERDRRHFRRRVKFHGTGPERDH